MGMGPKSKIALALMVGAVLGGVASQGGRAQSKPKAYLVTEHEVIDAAAYAELVPRARAAMQAFSGKPLVPGGGKIFALVGEPPKRFFVVEWESADHALAWSKSPEREAYRPLRDKAEKIIRQFILEAPVN
jgi:uncharacterized protein (DUF1330 family)